MKTKSNMTVGDNYYKCFIKYTIIDFAGIDYYAPKWAKRVKMYIKDNCYKFTFLK